MYKSKGYARYAARVGNIVDFYIYETYHLRENHYYIRSLKPLTIKAINIPRVGWVNIGL